MAFSRMGQHPVFKMNSLSFMSVLSSFLMAEG